MAAVFELEPQRDAEPVSAPGIGRARGGRMTTEVITHHIVARYSEESTKGTIEALHFGEKAKLQRSLKTSLVCLGVAGVCLCIPGAHFVLVPLTLLVSPLIIYKVHSQDTKIIKAEIACPKCHKPLEVLSSQERYPLFENCGECHREIRIDKA